MKNKFKLLLSITMLFSVLFSANVANAEESPPGIVAEYGASIEAQSGDLLYDKGAHDRAFPASITKIMTALLLAENIKEDETITISEKCVNEVRSNSQILFKAGEKMSRDTALSTMMTISANDVACAIGEHIAGNAEDFGALMTKRAKELGANDTQFKNANGLHNPEHYTTAYDMALIAQEAIKHDIILKAMGTKHYKVTTNLQKNVKVTNPSKIHDDPDSIGGKTGFTNQARNTLVKVDEKDGIRVINVVLKGNKYDYYDDIKRISNYGFEQLQKKKVVDKEKWSKNLTFLEKTVLVKPEHSLYLVTKKTDDSSYKVNFEQKKINKSLLYAKGIQKGQTVGEITVEKDGKKVDEVNVVSTKNLSFEKPDTFKIPFWVKVLVAIIVPLASYVGFVFLYNYKYFNNKKRPV